MSEEKQTRRIPWKRFVILFIFFVGAYCAYMGPSILKPVSPAVVVPAEPTGLQIAGLPISNTMMATLLTDILLVLMALAAWRFHRKGSLIPTGFYNAFEAIIEFLWSAVESQTGKWAKRIFPIVGTIFLLIFVANMVKLVPGFESIGYMIEAHREPAYAPARLFQIGSLGVFTIDGGQPVPVEDHAVSAEGGSGEELGHEEGASGGEGVPCKACELVPFLRGSATDLNFTLALAIIAVFLTQVYGVWALGPSYFGKFFQFGELFNGGVFGIINFGVGFLELILEFIKVVSFSFRLFGNIFAGALLLSIVGALLPILIPPILYGLEIFFGTIQAYVFYLLATVFISMALVSHHGGEHSE